MGYSARCFLALALLVTPGVAGAQAAFSGSNAPGASRPAAQPAPSPPQAQGTPAPQPAAGEPAPAATGTAAAGTPAAGYAYKDPPRAKRAARIAKRAGPV